MKGYVREIFSSIQGEGIKVGQRQTFVRFLGCNLDCDYCDTPDAKKVEGGLFYNGKIFPNPVEVDFLIDKIYDPYVSITGGEPLLQIQFLKVLCQKIKYLKKKIYLDTNATLPGNLEKIIEYIDTICVDFKIPTATGESMLWQEHERCLEISSKKEVFVKIVINTKFLSEELDETCRIIEKVDKNIPLVIQPVFGEYIPNILDIQRTALRRLCDVRVIPHVHKYLNIK